MISTKTDESGRVLTMSYEQHVGVKDMRRCLGTVRDMMADLKPGFLLFTDLSSLKSMDTSCASDLAAVMDLCDAKGMETVVRVIPDPAKDIGFALISCFHDHTHVHTRTYDNLADAVQSLCAQTSENASP